jgi:hypothetical protein
MNIEKMSENFVFKWAIEYMVNKGLVTCVVTLV